MNDKGKYLKAGLVGAAIGATTALLADKQNRQKATSTVKKFQQQAQEKINKLEAKTDKLANAKTKKN